MGVFLVLLGLLVGMVLSILAVGYVAVRGHFDEIPLSRSRAVGISCTVAGAFGAGFMTLGIFGYAIGQSLGDPILGSLITGLVGIGWRLYIMVVYGWRVTRRLAEVLPS